MGFALILQKHLLINSTTQLRTNYESNPWSFEDYTELRKNDVMQTHICIWNHKST